MSTDTKSLTFAHFMQGGLILFKIADFIDWSWWLVFLPVWISLAVIILEGALMGIKDFIRKHQ